MRFLAGLLDASQTVSFAAIGDLTTGEARFVAFGYSKAASQIAKILTSLIGGLTYDVKPGMFCCCSSGWMDGWMDEQMLESFSSGLLL